MAKKKKKKPEQIYREHYGADQILDWVQEKDWYSRFLHSPLTLCTVSQMYCKSPHFNSLSLEKARSDSSA